MPLLGYAVLFSLHYNWQCNEDFIYNFILRIVYIIYWLHVCLLYAMYSICKKKKEKMWKIVLCICKNFIYYLDMNVMYALCNQQKFGKKSKVNALKLKIQSSAGILCKLKLTPLPLFSIIIGHLLVLVELLKLYHVSRSMHEGTSSTGRLLKFMVQLNDSMCWDLLQFWRGLAEHGNCV